MFGLSDAIIGLTIFAVGNSLADLVANMSVAVRVYPAYAMVFNSQPQVYLGLRSRHGLLGLLRWANAQYLIRRRRFRLVCHPPQW